VGTLYIVGLPAGAPDSITLRALRILDEVALVFDDAGHAQRWWERQDLALPPVATADDALAALETQDAAVVCAGQSLTPSGPVQALIRAAIEHGFPVRSVPGPALPLTALVLSGLPADSFVCLGELPSGAEDRRRLLSLVATERRTILVQESPSRLADTLDQACGILGDRPLVLVTASEWGTEVVLRSTLSKASASPLEPPPKGSCVLVIGGSRDPETRWEEGPLGAEIQRRLEQGHSVTEIGRDLAVESGWPRRQIYRMAVDAAKGSRDSQPGGP
jgi:16S rRNA (cytidine1402-2'-O)-methyltransferase